MEFERSARVACLFQPVGGGLRYEAVHFLTFELLSQLDWGLRTGWSATWPDFLSCHTGSLVLFRHYKWLDEAKAALKNSTRG